MSSIHGLVWGTLFLSGLSLNAQASAPSKVVEAVDWSAPSASVKTQVDSGIAGEVLPGDGDEPARLKMDLNQETRCVAGFSIQRS